MNKNHNISSLEQPVEQMVDHFIDLTPQEAKILKNLGLKWIQEDEKALIDYAINKLLFDISQDITKRNELIRKVIAKEGKKL